MKKCLIFTYAMLLTQTATAQYCRDDILASAPDSRFTVNGNEVTGIETKLIWQHCTLGQTGNDCSGGNPNRYTWQEALQAAENERTNTGQSWRLPNRNELKSIVEIQCYAPAINLAIFPNTITYGWYWSSSPNAYDYSGSAWILDFDHGNSKTSDKNDSISIRLVRDAQ